MTSVYDWSPTNASTNGTVDTTAGISIAEGATPPPNVNNGMRAMMLRTAQLRDDLGAVVVVGGTANALAITTSGTAYTTYATGMYFRFIAAASNTAAATALVNAGTTKKIRKISGGTDVDLAAGDILIGQYYEVIFAATADSSAGAWVLQNQQTAFATNAQSLAGTSTTLAVDPANLNAERQLVTTPVNLGLVASVGASALTIALKGVDGNDPSATNPVYVPFRNVTAATGTPSYLTVTAATSLVISSGSTLGAPTGSVPFKVWVVAFNDAGTFRLAAILCTTLAAGVLAQHPLAAWGIASSTAEGGAGAADSAQTFYTGTAVTSKSYTVLGVLSFESGLATAGTWAAAPTRAQIFDASVPLPGRVVQNQSNLTGAVATGTTTIPQDDTIPQNTEGTQFMSQAITPTSAGNLLRIWTEGVFASTANAALISALFQDTTASAIAASLGFFSGSNPNITAIRFDMIAGTSASTTFKLRVGAQTGAGVTLTFNGIASGRIMGGVNVSFIGIEEIAA